MFGFFSPFLSNHEAAGANVKIPLQPTCRFSSLPVATGTSQYNAYEGEFPYGVRTSTAPL